MEVDDESLTFIGFEQPSAEGHVVGSLDLHVLGVAALLGGVSPAMRVV